MRRVHPGPSVYSAPVTFRSALTLEQQILCARRALDFFSVKNHDAVRTMLGRPATETVQSWAMSDFLSYLQQSGFLEDPSPWIPEISRLLGALERHDLLVPAGSTGAPRIGRRYWQMDAVPSDQAAGDLWLAPVLGPQLIVSLMRPAVMRLEGLNSAGDQRGGTGLAISEHHIITAKHVVTDMELSDSQPVPGSTERVTVQEVKESHQVDFAVVVLEPDGLPLQPAAGLALREPTWADPLLTLGYPPIPRADAIPLTVQGGEVVTPRIRDYGDGRELFLYSAITRPGNSGGPIVGADGRLLGMVTDELFAQGDASVGAPYYAGLPASVLASCLSDLGIVDHDLSIS